MQARMSARVGHRLLSLNAEQAALHRPAERHRELGNAEQADGNRDETDAVGEACEIESHARRAGIDVDTDKTEQQPDQHHRDGFFRRAVGEHHRAGEPEHHQAEILGGIELEREAAHRRARGRDHDGRDGARKERGDRGDRERGAGAALLRHLVAVEAGDDGRGFTRHVDKDRRGRTAILRAVENAREHDQR